MQQITIVGRVGRSEYTRNDKIEVCNLSIATNRYNGKNKDATTDWHSVVVFGSRAKSLHENIENGDLLSVTGTIKYEIAEHAEKKFKLARIIVDDFEFLTSKKEQENRKKA